MPKFSANLTWMFGEVGFLERFERVAQAGFKGVEFMFPYEFKAGQLAELLDKHHLEQVLLNLPAGDWQKGERGIACLPGREAEFQEGVGRSVEYAKALKCSRVNCLVGITPAGVPANKVRETMVSNLRFAAQTLDKAGVRLLVEALNSRDAPGFHLVHTQDVVKLLEEVNHPNAWLQYDIYHMQVMEGNLTQTIRDNVKRIAHMQLGDVPGRHEPGSGEINFPNLFRFIDESGYDGWIGCEYKPAGKTEDGLGWVKPYLKKGVS
ncbi:MAG: hydroxypyruvate isomerase [Chloroflexi bacterium]|nr:hydroxypyruvate isomerase [Chloroflexota bacterium]